VHLLAGRRVTRDRHGWRVAVVLLGASVLAAGCDRHPANASQAEFGWTLSPSPPVVGPSQLSVTVRSRGGQPVTGAQVRLEAYMSHPGMAPVQANAVERGAGVYEVPFTFTMAGDWVLVVVATLPQGERVERRFDAGHVRPPG
jgi:YtkA-like